MEGRGKRRAKLITTQVEKKDIFDEGDIWEENSE